MEIPKIIHQIYEDPEGPSELVLKFAASWKEKNPGWEYCFWGKEEIETFFESNFNHLYHSVYKKFPFNIQRWDLIRLLILYVHGGLYVDMDYECLKPIDDLFEGHTCCLGLEPEKNAQVFEMPYLVGNAFVASVPGHDFLMHVISEVQLNGLKKLAAHNPTQVMKSTGPFFFTKMYHHYKRKRKVHLIPSNFVTPFVLDEARHFLSGKNKYGYLLKDAYAIHYFLGSWINEIDNRDELEEKKT